jgi:hypothetical protein
VAEALTNEEAFDVMARTAAGLRAAGYDQASQLAMSDIANAMQGQGLNLQAAGMMGDMSNIYQNMGLQGSEALQNLGLAPLNLRLGVLSGTPGTLGGTSQSKSVSSGSSSQSSWNQGQNWGTSQSTGKGSSTDLGGVALGIGTAISDRRLKESIEQVGVDGITGLPVYEFQYIGQPEKRYRGVMADDVEDVMPEAVITGSDGYKRVNYDMLGISMQEV